jgi:hypothetical protein
VHKGTFLRIAESMRMPSAYFLLPHNIALHNEALLDEAVAAGSSVLDVDAGTAHRAPPMRADPLLAARRSITTALAQCVDAEAIHYPNLRALYDRAAGSRGLHGLESRARRYAEDLSVEADGIRARQQSLAQVALAAIALVIAVVQIKDTVPLAVGVPVAVALAIACVLLLPKLMALGRSLRRDG